MEFKEFENPEEKDYDIKSNNQIIKNISNDEIEISKSQKEFLDLWIDLGMPEIYELEPFGINEKEFENPTKQTLIKLKMYAKKYKEEKTIKKI